MSHEQCEKESNRMYYSSQFGATTLEPQSMGLNGKARMSEFVGMTSPQPVWGTVPVTGMPTPVGTPYVNTPFLPLNNQIPFANPTQAWSNPIPQQVPINCNIPGVVPPNMFPATPIPSPIANTCLPNAFAPGTFLPWGGAFVSQHNGYNFAQPGMFPNAFTSPVGFNTVPFSGWNPTTTPNYVNGSIYGTPIANTMVPNMPVPCFSTRTSTVPTNILNGTPGIVPTPITPVSSFCPTPMTNVNPFIPTVNPIPNMFQIPNMLQNGVIPHGMINNPLCNTLAGIPGFQNSCGYGTVPWGTGILPSNLPTNLTGLPNAGYWNCNATPFGGTSYPSTIGWTPSGLISNPIANPTNFLNSCFGNSCCPSTPWDCFNGSGIFANPFCPIPQAGYLGTGIGPIPGMNSNLGCTSFGFGTNNSSFGPIYC